MPDFLHKALDWSEVWALLIPFTVLYFRRNQPKTLQPVIVYLWFAMFINLICDIIMDFYPHFPDWLHTNNPFYNIQSVGRFFCFSFFFIKLQPIYFFVLKKLLAWLAMVFLLINFVFFENFFYEFHLSGNLLSTEAYLLLVYCMLYYLAALRDDSNFISEGKDFWIVTGLSIYLVINFFIFLFYVPMLENKQQVNDIWNIHNIAYIIFCIFIAKAFYGPIRNKYTN